MIQKSFLSQLFFHLVGIFPFLCLNASALKLYLVSNHLYPGEHNQVLGIFAALRELAPGKISFKDLNTQTLSPLKIRNIIENQLPHTKVMIIAAGEDGIDGIKELHNHPNLIICLTSHMILERHKDQRFLENVRFIALPSHAASKVRKLLGKRLVETVGVPHNRHSQECDKVYKEWKKKELLPCTTYFCVVLGGDAPLPGPKRATKRFTKIEAIKLADYVARTNSNSCILVLNGPRTGQYDKHGKEILKVHRKGYSDAITESFRQRLMEKGAKVIKVFAFQHNTPENKPWVRPYNTFDLVVGALRATGGEILVPGDSTSVVSEAIDTLPPGKVLVYEDGAMNEVHKAHIESELAAGRIRLLKNYHAIKDPTSTSHPLSTTAAQVIAQRLWEEATK